MSQQRFSNPPTASSGVNSQPAPTNLREQIAVLNQILNVLNELVLAGSLTTTIEYQTITAGGTPQLLYPNSKPVRFGLIQNLGATEVLTFFAAAGSVGKPIQGTASQGTVLNPASVAGQAGSSLPIGNEDLGTYTVLGATTGHGYSIRYAW